MNNIESKEWWGPPEWHRGIPERENLTLEKPNKLSLSVFEERFFIGSRIFLQTGSFYFFKRQVRAANGRVEGPKPASI